MAEIMKVVTRNMDVPDQHTIAVAMQNGAYEQLKKALEMTPDAIIEEVKKSGLRGRGGAGFPAGLKWSFVPKQAPKPKYMCVNADEGEPGTFKDRVIMSKDPHLLVEGILIACYAIGIRDAYIYIRGEFVEPANILQKAIDEAYEKGFIGENILGKDFTCHITVHRGAGAYVCGEETGLIESLEGKRGQPRLKPPFPAVVGAFQGPTVVNNVETLANVPRIFEHGADWFAAIGVEKNSGTRLFGISGHVNKPGVYELPMGTPIRELIELAGGVRGGRKIKAVVPGGSSAPALTPDQLDTQMSFDALGAIGSMGGSGGVIVMDETTNLVCVLTRLLEFYAHESCGQCTPCREGVAWLKKIMQRIRRGQGKIEDIDLMLEVAGNIMGNTLCPLGDAAAMPTRGFLTKFRAEFEAFIKSGANAEGTPMAGEGAVQVSVPAAE
jgi:NADH-quinone oxidoreductase subunit F